MSPWLAFFTGLFVGGGIVLYGMSLLIQAAAPSYPPEVRDRLEEHREEMERRATWN